MEKVIQFLLEYWKELASILIALLTFLVCLFRKRGKVDPTLLTILESVPSVLVQVEENVGVGSGAEKKRLAMLILCTLYKKSCGLDLVEGSATYRLISDYVEKVLLAPHKKEDK